MLRALTRKPPPIGMDVAPDGIRMMQFSAIGKAITTIAGAYRAFPPEAATDIARRRELAVAAVKEMLAEGGFRGRRVVTCLSSDELSINQVRLPQMAEHERVSAIQWEADERFDFPVSPELLHHLVAGEVRSGNEVRDEAILLGVAENVIDDHVSLIEEMDLSPVAVDAEPICVFRPFERFLRRGADEDKVSALVDVRHPNTWVVFARGRQICFVKSIDLGGRHFTEAVAKQLNLSVTEAASLRRQMISGGSTGDAGLSEQIQMAVRDAVRPVLEELAREVSLCLRYCAVTFRGVRPDQVTLVGSEAGDPCVQELLGESINIDCEIGRPLRGIDLSLVELGGDHRGPLCEWSVAAGLALRHFMAEQDRRERKNEPDRLLA